MKFANFLILNYLSDFFGDEVYFVFFPSFLHSSVIFSTSARQDYRFSYSYILDSQLKLPLWSLH